MRRWATRLVCSHRLVDLITRVCVHNPFHAHQEHCLPPLATPPFDRRLAAYQRCRLEHSLGMMVSTNDGAAGLLGLLGAAAAAKTPAEVRVWGVRQSTLVQVSARGSESSESSESS